MTTQVQRMGATALVAVAMWVGAAGSAHAAPVPDIGTNELSVSVPSATPTASTPPPGGGPGGVDNPGAGTPPPAGSDPAAGPGSSVVPVRSGSGGTAAPAAGASAPTSAPCVPKEPAVPTAPTTGGREASVDKEVYVIGETVTAVAGGFGAGEQVQLVLFSEPVLVGTFAADVTGAVTAQFAIAEKTLAGSHTVQFTGWCGTTSSADLLVGSTNNAGSAGPQGVPIWAWWIGGGLGLLLLIAAAWWAIRTMRMPDARPEVVTA